MAAVGVTHLVKHLKQLEDDPVLDYLNIDGYIYLPDICRSHRVVNDAVKQKFHEISAKLTIAFYMGPQAMREENMALLTAAGFETKEAVPPGRIHTAPMVHTKKGILVVS